jgi:hypothetical protein
MSEAARQDDAVRSIERAADDLADALKATGSPMDVVHPNAIVLANELLASTGYELTRKKS